jgi:dTDP-4-dehydrorhamnose 3,5-epimerase
MATSSPDFGAEVQESVAIVGVVVVRPEAHGDARGRFVETYRRSWIAEGREMVQGNRSDTGAGSLLGLHSHLHQADYWYVTRGIARVVLHDLREGSPTEGATLVFDMGDGNDLGVYIPPGVAHGFAALTDVTMTYLVDRYYSPEDELGVAWDDPEIAADWGITEPILSRRDQTNPRRVDIPPGQRPLLGPAPIPRA